MRVGVDGQSREALWGPAAALEGVVVHRGELAQRGYRLNCFLVDISQHDQRQQFLADEEGAMERASLTEQERALVRQRDYNAMLAYGVNVYALVKAGYVFGHHLMQIGDIMRKPAATPAQGAA